MKKTKLTRSLMAACSIVALSAVMYGCVHSGGDDPMEPPAVDMDALDAAKAAAMSAATMAMTSATAAQTAVNDVSGVQGADQASYNMAQAQADAANAAYMAAKTASDAAADATTVADAQMYQQTAEAEQAKAATASTNASTYAGMVSNAADAVDAARTAAMAAATAADAAADAAEAAVMAQSGNQSADSASYAVAQNAAMRARAAADAAAAASTEAGNAATPADAEAQRDTALAKQAEAETEQANAEKYADMVQMAQDDIDAENQRVMDVAAARIAAQGSYEAAEADATKAEMQADDAEAVAPGSPGAIAARNAATAARAAAVAAKAAHDAITDGMTKAEADAKAQEAADEAGKANAGYMTAKAENEDIQTTGSQIAENNRKQAVSDARRYGGMAVENAKSSADDARDAANAAKTASDDANAEYERAKSARTNAPKAEEAKNAALAAYMAADSAADDAHTAYMAAKAAVDGVMDDSTLQDANTARDTAEEQEGIAADHETTALTQQMMAETAHGNATKYANEHVVGLLMMANAFHIGGADQQGTEGISEATATARKNHVTAVNLAVKTAADDATDPEHGGGTVTAVTWHYYGDLGADGIVSTEAQVETDAANADTEPGEGKLMLTVTPSDETAVVLRHADPDADPAVTANFEDGHGLGDFSHEKYITNGADGTRIILFTDIEQAKASENAIRAAVKDLAVTASQITTWSTTDGAGRYDHDGDSKTAPLPGDFSCGRPDPNSCTVVVQGGEVQSISGYVFTSTDFDDGTDHVIVTEKPSAQDTTYLAFGIWIDEDPDGDDDGVREYTFGAFAAGGDVWDQTADGDIGGVKGDATYTGSAAGVHSTDTDVEFFHGDVELKAKFGEAVSPDAADDNNGTITGKIHNIYAGGDPVPDDIYLYLSDQDAQATTGNISDAGAFSGRTRMGSGTLGDDGEYDYPMNGTWNGNFYNAVADNTATANVDESEMAPGSAAGTFSVSRGDDDDTPLVDETESYVGAFGAHCSVGDCGTH